MTSKLFEPINSAANDYYNEDGTRFSLPFYLDLPNQKRKELLNAVRETIQLTTTTTSEVPSLSGIKVESYTGNSVEQYIGMDIAVLRGVLFQRGGLPADLVLRIQAVTGASVVTEAELKKAFDTRKKKVLSYVTDNPPPANG